jgi:uncharacterized protein
MLYKKIIVKKAKIPYLSDMSTTKGFDMKILDIIAIILLIIGGLNWGLIGLFRFDFIDFLFSHRNELHMVHHSVISRFLDVLIGASAVYLIVQRKNVSKRWN